MKSSIHKRKSRNLEQFALKTTQWAERWFPDSYIFAILAVILVTLAALAVGAPPQEIIKSFGNGYWSLIPFTLQMSVVVISGYIVASSPPAAKLIYWLATLPKTEKGAVAAIAFFTILASLLNWAFSLVFGGLYVRALARRSDIQMDYRAAGAAGYLGLGATWALGLSSSAAQLQANLESIPKTLLPITGVIPFNETIFLSQSFLMLSILTTVSVVVAYLSAPARNSAITARALGIDVLSDQVDSLQKPTQPSEWLEYSPLLTIFVVTLGLSWLCLELSTKNWILTISNLNTYNLLFLMLGMLLSWRPKRFLKSVEKAVPSIAGILIQFPLYGSIAYILTQAKTESGLTLSHSIANFFISVSTQNTYPAFMALYSAVLGFFVPSGGGKWIIEAPYLMQAANELKIHLGWTVMIYNASEALPNLINPFFMAALVGVIGLKARDIVGYTMIQFIVNTPLVIFLLWLFSRTIEYHPPIY